MRFCFRQDDDGNWYLLTEKETNSFDKLRKQSNDMEDYTEEWFDVLNEFEGFNRVNSPTLFTFETPEED